MTISRYRKMILEVFIGLFVFTVLTYAYKLWNPYRYIGFESKALWITLLFFLLVLLSYFPYSRVIPYLRTIPSINPEGMLDFSVKRQGEYAKSVVDYLFITTTGVFIIAILLKGIWDFIEEVISIENLLIAVIIFGLASKFFGGGTFKKKKLGKTDYYISILIGSVTSASVYYRIHNIGTLGVILSLVTGVFSVILYILFIKEDVLAGDYTENKNRV